MHSSTLAHSDVSIPMFIITIFIAAFRNSAAIKIQQIIVFCESSNGKCPNNAKKETLHFLLLLFHMSNCFLYKF